MDEPTFRVAEIVCDSCGEHLYIARGDDELDAQQQHVERHKQGICRRCGHWNDEHRALAFYDHQGVCCVAYAGMGDFCGCAGLPDEEGDGTDLPALESIPGVAAWWDDVQ
jgi:hypothetical protein